MDEFELPADVRERALAGAFDAAALTGALEHAQRPSQLRAALAGRPVEAIAIAAARGTPQVRDRARSWLQELRGVELAIGGGDLLAAGIPEGPEIGRRLARALDRLLDGELAGGREAELAAALGDDG
jgi:tRNA nucleotidyltransferase (CCA-adding enzyme)